MWRVWEPRVSNRLSLPPTKWQVPEPLKSGALEWYASLSAPSRLRPAARFAAKEKTPDNYGSSRKQKTVQEAREDSVTPMSMTMSRVWPTYGYGSLGVSVPTSSPRTKEG